MLKLDKFGIFEITDPELLAFSSGAGPLDDPTNPFCNSDAQCSVIGPGGINAGCGTNTPCGGGGGPDLNAYCSIDTQCAGNYPCHTNPDCIRP